MENLNKDLNKDLNNNLNKELNKDLNKDLNNNLNKEFGFILTRHVRCEKTNQYWNRSVQLLSRLYPRSLIVIIDDNSDARFVKEEYPYGNIKIIQSEYPGRGELLPYIYYSREKWFEKAVILHDSVFFHTRIPFEKIDVSTALPLWYFPKIHNKTHLENNMRVASVLPFRQEIGSALLNDSKFWRGCFGAQSYIRHSFLVHLMRRYKLFRLLAVIKKREDRCSLERILGILFYLEGINPRQSLLGNIFHYDFGLSWEQYNKQHNVSKVYKIFSGR